MQHEIHRTVSGSTKQYTVDRNSPSPAHFRNSAIGSLSDLPNYNQMVMLIKQECKEAGSNKLVLWFKMYTFVGQLMTTVGKACWGAVVWKYCGFIQVCFGIWTVEGYKAMHFPDRLTEVVLGDDQSEEGKKRLGKGYLSCVKCVVAPRSILFLAIPTPVTTVFAVFAQCMADSPFFVCQPFADHVPEYLKLPGYGEAIDPDLPWYERFLTLISNLMAKRVLKLPYNLFNFLTMAGIATLPLSFWEEHWRIEIATGIFACHACLRGLKSALKFSERLWKDHKASVETQMVEMSNLGSGRTAVAAQQNPIFDGGSGRSMA